MLIKTYSVKLTIALRGPDPPVKEDLMILRVLIIIEWEHNKSFQKQLLRQKTKKASAKIRKRVKVPIPHRHLLHLRQVHLLAPPLQNQIKAKAAKVAKTRLKVKTRAKTRAKTKRLPRRILRKMLRSSSLRPSSRI